MPRLEIRRFRPIFGYAVLALGMLILTATSAVPHWQASESSSTYVESTGGGDAKRLRVRVRMDGPLAADAHLVEVSLQGSVSRPASDLTLAWVAPSDDAGRDASTGQDDASLPADGGLTFQRYSVSNDFLTVYAYTYGVADCAAEGACELEFEARLDCLSPDAYTMDLTANVLVRGQREHRPTGTLTVTAELDDAP
jgi:hypothetical protein